MATASDQLPLVCVCVPVYNGVQYIGKAIESILNQTYPNWKLVVIDNASTDGTVEQVQSYKDPRISLLRNPTNRGFEYNWNRCLTEAAGDFFKLLPADDVLEPRCLERQVEAMEKNEGVVLVGTRRTIVDSRGDKIMVRGLSSKDVRLSGVTAIRRLIRSGANPIGEPGAVMLRVATIAQVGKFDVTDLYVVDADYWVRTLILGDLYFIGQPLAQFRVSGSSTSTALSQRQASQYVAWIKRLKIRYPNVVSGADVVMGTLRARVNQYIRALLYRFLTKES